MSRFVAAIPLLLVCSFALGSTAAFQGKVTAVGDCPAKSPECVRTFTVRIDYFDYISWGKFGRQSKVGESITRRVRNRGTVCVLDGELTNAHTLGKAFREGTWGYFYEDTWLNLRTTPEFVWGELVEHDSAKSKFVLRLHSTHKDHHIESNPPVDREFTYDKATAFQVDGKPVDPATAFSPGAWVQVHAPRPQIVLVRTRDSAYDPSEQLPADMGKRGYANDLTRPAVLQRIESKTPDGVIDVAARITVHGEEGSPETIEARSVSFVLDGKLAPVRIANRAGRRAVLCYYRSEKRPHKVFLEAADDAIRGTVVAIEKTGERPAVVIHGTDESGAEKQWTLPVEADATIQLDGVPTLLEKALVPGRTITLHPARGRTIVGIPSAD